MQMDRSVKSDDYSKWVNWAWAEAKVVCVLNLKYIPNETLFAGPVLKLQKEIIHGEDVHLPHSIHKELRYHHAFEESVNVYLHVN